MILYVSLLTASAGISALLTYWVRRTAIAYGLKATPVYGRHLHTQPLPRLGGIAICATFMTAAAAYIPISRLLQVSVSIKGYLGILVPGLLIFLMGAYDDVKPLKPKSKIAVQSLAAILLYVAGFGIHYFTSLFGGHPIGAKGILRFGAVKGHLLIELAAKAIAMEEDEELVEKLELDELRNYVRFGNPNHVWPISIRR